MADYVVSDAVAAQLDGDVEFAETFASIARAIDGTPKSQDVTLLLSTCRNQYLTTNAIFVDLRLALSTGTTGSMFEALIRDLRHPRARRDSDRKKPESYEALRALLTAAKHKRTTWADRSDLLRSYKASVELMNRPADRRRAMSVFAAPPVRRYPDGDQWDARYLGISIDEDVCSPALQTLYRLQEDCWHALDLIGALLGPAIEVDRVRLQEEKNQDAWVEVDVSSPLKANSLISSVIPTIEKRDVWQLVRSGDDVIVSLSPRLATDDGAILKLEGDSSLRETFDLVIQAIESFLESARQVLRKEFEPNLARKPMPEPYVIDLRLQDPAGSSTARPLKVRTVASARTTPPPNTVKVAVMHAVIPSEWYNHSAEVVYETGAVNVALITRCITDAISRCQGEGVSALILPEYFIPRAGLDRIVQAAEEAELLLVGGVEATKEEGKVVNEAAIWLPDSGALRFQRKHKPSKYEHGENYFAMDERVLVFANTVLGNLGVIVCSDYLEADVMSELTVGSEDLVHTIVVCARNPNSAAFNALAKADAIRYYANVLVANSTDRQVVVGDGEAFEEKSGCFLALPTISERPVPTYIELDPIAPGVPAPTLVVRDLPMGTLRSRSHRGHPEHWMTPSNFASKI